MQKRGFKMYRRSGAENEQLKNDLHHAKDIIVDLSAELGALASNGDVRGISRNASAPASTPQVASREKIAQASLGSSNPENFTSKLVESLKKEAARCSYKERRKA